MSLFYKFSNAEEEISPCNLKRILPIDFCTSASENRDTAETLKSSSKHADYPAKGINDTSGEVASISSIKKNVDELSLNVARTVSLTKEISTKISKISREINMRTL